MLGSAREVLADLVSIHSVNPRIDGGPGEAEIADYVSRAATSVGADVETHEVAPGRTNVLAWVRRGGRPAVLLECHLDTVGLEPMPDALRPRVEGGRLFGRGAADPKGSLAAMLKVLEAAALDAEFPVDVCLAGAVDEETHMEGSRALAEMRLPVAAAVVGEPTELRVVTAEKGAVRWRIRTRGTSAHSSAPERGHNAIYDMATVIAALRAAMDPLVRAREHPLLGAAAWSIGTIQGGVAANVVPDACEVELDRRTLPGQDAETVFGEVDRALDDLRGEHPELRIERGPAIIDLPAVELAADAPIVRAARSAVDAAGLNANPVGVAFASDAAMLAGVGGIPAVIMGPGNIAQGHTDDEWIELSQVDAAVGLYVDTCRAFAELAA